MSKSVHSVGVSSKLKDANITKIRIPLRGFFDNPLIFLLILFFQFGLLYFLGYWGYYNMKFPYYVDNYISDSGLWKIFGKRDLNYISEYDKDAIVLTDPLYSNIESNKYMISVSGFLRDIKKINDHNYMFTIETSDQGEVTFEASILSSNIYGVKDCSNIDNCGLVQYEEGVWSEEAYCDENGNCNIPEESLDENNKVKDKYEDLSFDDFNEKVTEYMDQSIIFLLLVEEKDSGWTTTIQTMYITIY
ncbi:hypothetical protein JW887_05135 [Candidatus Dojkabacteria bacterium]|nr:hypothetical protein [Candidatus Dojkabacteria bacterium]